MQWLAGIPALLAAFLAFVGRKTSVAVVTIASFILMTAVFIACINILVGNLASLLAVPAWLSVALGMFIPTNFGAVLSAIISSYICRAAYDLAMLKIKAINQAN